MTVPDSGATDGAVDALDVINRTHYPLDDPSGPGLEAVVARVRRELAVDGCSVLRDFVDPGHREALRRECAEVAPLAHFEVADVNVYNTAPDPALAPDHPARTIMRRGNAFVARDRIPAGTVVQRLYTDPRFQRFVADCFDLPRVHELADPLAGLCLNVLSPGEGHPWHFDTNEFTVSMLTQQPDSGGEFEYCAHIRSPAAENIDAVRAVLDGRPDDRLRVLPLRPGDLQLFRGRYSLHRVRAVGGGTARHSAIFAYSQRPDVVGTAERTRQLFGRTTQAHVEAGAAADRVDHLMD